MNEHNNTAKSDADISQLYAQASNEQPPIHIDDAILAAAQTLIKEKPSTIATFSRRWSVPVSLAAVIVMSVSLVTLIQHEAPEELISLPESVLSQAAAPKTEIIKSEAIPPRAVRKEKPSVAYAKKRAAPRAALKPVAPAYDIIIAEEESVFAESLAPQKQMADTAQDSIADKRTTDSSTTQIKEKSKQPGDPRSFGDKSATAALSAIAPPSSCESLTVLHCLESMQCTLTAKESSYRCRQARNHCEQDFSQKTGTAEQCTAKPNCKFVPGKCFCPPNVICVCGGGPPRMCVPE